MANKPKSFEEFFYIKTDSILDIEIINNYADKHKGNYTPYKGSMLCPECQKAELTFIRKSSSRRAHLKRIPSGNHLEDCSYNYEYGSKKLIKEYVDTLSYKQIQDRLNTIINMLCNNKQKRIVTLNNSDIILKANDNPVLIPDILKEPRNLKALRRKRLAGWIDKSDGTDLHIFFGKVKLSVEERTRLNEKNKENSYYILTLKTQNKNEEWRYRTSIYRGGVKDSVDEDKVYQIAIIGNLNFEYKWWQIKLVNQNAIRYEDIDS